MKRPELIVVLIVEGNSAFSLIESTTFYQLIGYQNCDVPLLS